MFPVLQAAEDEVGEISNEDTTTIIPLASRAINFERVKPRSHVVKKTKAHIEAEKNLRGNEGQEQREARRRLAEQRRKVEARRGTQSMQFGCLERADDGKKVRTQDRQIGTKELERFVRKKYQDD